MSEVVELLVEAMNLIAGSGLPGSDELLCRYDDFVRANDEEVVFNENEKVFGVINKHYTRKGRYQCTLIRILSIRPPVSLAVWQ